MRIRLFYMSGTDERERRREHLSLTRPLITYVHSLNRAPHCSRASAWASIYILNVITYSMPPCFFNEPLGCSHKVRQIHNWRHCSSLVNVPLIPGPSLPAVYQCTRLGLIFGFSFSTQENKRGTTCHIRRKTKSFKYICICWQPFLHITCLCGFTVQSCLQWDSNRAPCLRTSLIPTERKVLT